MHRRRGRRLKNGYAKFAEFALNPTERWIALDLEVHELTKPHFQVVALDCPDPLALAAFYSRLTGLAVEPLGDFAPEEVTWIEIENGDHPAIGFQKVDNYMAPTWPEGPRAQQLHIDFTVPDLDDGERHVLSIGATKAEYQPGETFRVYFDPVGHPFCLVLRDE